MGVDLCEECGFRYDPDDAPGASASIVNGAGEIAGILGDPGGDIYIRRNPQLWSPLEYACHVRDVLSVSRERLFLARRVDCPRFEPMGRDERVEYDGYSDQRASDVARQLIDAASLFANALSRLREDEWDRTCVYNYPEPAKRSLHWFAVHVAHEVQHHVFDIRRQMM